MQITNNNNDMKKRFWKIFGITTSILIISIVLFGVLAFVGFKKSDKYVKFDKNRLNEVYTSLTLLDNDGAKIQEPLYLYDYKQIPIDALHDYTYMAFVSVEDKRFFSHNGIDYKRVAGALIHNLKSGNYKEGASTISQQLIKNTHLDNYKTIKRKLNEMTLARELERNYSKKEILEMYLNTIYFGRNAYGIESASNVYFDKSAKDLTVSESAILAGMIKAPNNYAPDKNAAKCKQRRGSVLKIMLDQQVISEEEYLDAIQSEISYRPQNVKREKTYTYHVMQEACKLLNMTPMQLAQSNFIIETYCNPKIQKDLQALAGADATLTKHGVLADMSCIVANNKGGVEACFFRGDTAGEKRQVGSALKPIAVYAPALNERIISQASPILDEETDFNGYKPANAGGYNGWTTVKYAVAKSLNVPAVKTLNALGLDTAQNYLNKFGIKGKQNLSLALGNAEGGINALTLTKCYATLANDGLCNEVAFIKNIYSENGLIYSRNLDENRVFQSGANYLMTDMLINTVNSGTAKLLSSKYQIAAKTGTVGNKTGNSDAIVAGYTTKNTFVVWYSGDLDNSISGSTAPSSFAGKLLNKIYKDKSPANFGKPDGIVELKLDKNELYKNQRLYISANGEKFMFENSNKPKNTLQEETYEYAIEAQIKDNEVFLRLPDVETGYWQLYKITDDGAKKLAIENNSYKEKIDKDEEYYAELNFNGEKVYTTPKIKICYNKDKNNNQDEKFPSLTDFWYWR